MLQQSFNFLKKKAYHASQGKNMKEKHDGIFAYFGEAKELMSKKCKVTKAEQWLNLETIEEALKVSLAYKN